MRRRRETLPESVLVLAPVVRQRFHRTAWQQQAQQRAPWEPGAQEQPAPAPAPAQRYGGELLCGRGWHIS